MLISVIIPAYNIEDCLERCVRSVCDQTHDDLEILIVDDGSTDDTLTIADTLAESDQRIRVIHQSNGGTSAARNRGLRQAMGEYIGFVDADDCIEPFMYERLLGFMEEHHLLCAQICRDEIDDRGEPLPMVVTPPSEPKIIGSADFMRDLLMHVGDCSLCTKLTHRSLFDIARFPEGELNEDFRLFTAFLSHMDGVGSLPDIGYHVHYRQGSNTRTEGSVFSRVYTDIVVNADRVSILVDESYPELQEVAVRFGLVQRLDYLLHIPIPSMTRSNSFYRRVVGYLRSHRSDIRRNPYLTDDQRSKLRLLSVAPRTVRSVHARIMRLRRA